MHNLKRIYSVPSLAQMLNPVCFSFMSSSSPPPPPPWGRCCGGQGSQRSLFNVCCSPTPTPHLPKLGTIFSAVVSNPEYCFSHEINVSLFLIVSIWSLEWIHSALTEGLHGCTGEKKNGRRLKKRKRGWPHGSCPQLSKDINRQNTHTCKSHKPSHRKNIGMPPSVLFLRCLRALHRWNLRQITF